MRKLMLACVCLLLAACGKPNAPAEAAVNTAQAPAANETTTARKEAILEAFGEVHGASSATADDVIGIQALLDTLVILKRRRDSAAAGNSIDFELMLRVAADQVTGPRPPDDLLAESASMLRKRLGSSWFADESPLFSWLDNRIAKVEMSQDGEMALAYCRHRVDDDGAFEKARWWCRRDGIGWQLYDLEILSSGMRMTHMLAAGMQSVRDKQHWSKQVADLQQAQVAIKAGDFDRADRLLRDAEKARFPAEFEAVRRFYLATVLLATESPIAAGRMAQEALDRNPEMLEAYIVLGRSNHALENYEAAVKHFQAYIDRLGPDPLTLVELADSLTWLDRHEEAETMYRRSLEEFPTVGALIGLGLCLDSTESKQLGQWLSRLPNPANAYLLLLERLYDEDFVVEHARALNDAYRKIKPDDPMLAWYTAQVFEDDGDYAAAAAALKPALAKAPADRVEDFEWEYLSFMTHAGKAVQALNDAGRTEDVFRDLASLARSGAAIIELCEAWRKGNEENIYLHFFLGYGHSLEGEHAAAEPHLRRALGMTEAGSALEIATRSYLTRSLAWQGKAVEAYHELEPSRELANQLAKALLAKGDAEQLDALIAAHAELDPEDPQLTRYKGDAAWLHGDWKAAVGFYTAYAKAGDFDADSLRDLWERRIRASLRSGETDEALAAAQAGVGGLHDSFWQVLAGVAAGKLDVVMAGLEELLDWHYDVQELLYADPDIGEALLGEAWADVRKLVPPPETDPKGD